MTRVLRSAVALLAVALVASGCAEDQAAAPHARVSVPTGNVEVPDGVTLTEPGSTLGFAQGATVAFSANESRGTVLRMTVTRVRQGRIADLSAYDLDARTARSVPYYVTVRVRNIGTGQVGRSAIPLWALTGENTLVGSSGFTNAFTRCPSRHLPARFGPGRSATACLMYLLPRRERLVGVSYRPVMAEAPVVWKGEITPPPEKKATKKTSKASKPKSAKKVSR